MKLGFDYRQMILIIACSVLLIQYCTTCLLAETPEPWFQDTNGPFYSTSALYACNIVPFFFGREIFFKQWNHRDFSLAVPRIIPGYLEHVFQFLWFNSWYLSQTISKTEFRPPNCNPIRLLFGATPIPKLLKSKSY